MQDCTNILSGLKICGDNLAVWFQMATDQPHILLKAVKKECRSPLAIEVAIVAFCIGQQARCRFFWCSRHSYSVAM